MYTHPHCFNETCAETNELTGTTEKSFLGDQIIHNSINLGKISKNAH